MSVSGIKTSSQIAALANSSASNPEIVKIGPKATVISQPTLIQGQQANSTGSKIVQSAQLQPITAQQLVNAKVLGVQGFQGLSQVTSLNPRVKPGTSIRMVNASNLNIANIDGKQVIIAKTPTMIQSNQLAKSAIWTQQSNNVGKANIISTSQIQPSQVMFGNQIVKIQSSTVQTNSTTPTMSVINLNANSTNNTMTTATRAGTNMSTGTARTVVLGSTGQAIKVHTPNLITTTAGVKPTVKVSMGSFRFTSDPFRINTFDYFEVPFAEGLRCLSKTKRRCQYENKKRWYWPTLPNNNKALIAFVYLISECHQRDQLNSISRPTRCVGCARRQPVHSSTKFPRQHDQLEIATRSQNDSDSNAASHSNPI